MCVCVCARALVCLCVCACVRARACVPAYVSACVRVCVGLRVLCVHARARVCVFIYNHMYCMCVCVQRHTNLSNVLPSTDHPPTPNVTKDLQTVLFYLQFSIMPRSTTARRCKHRREFLQNCFQWCVLEDSWQAKTHLCFGASDRCVDSFPGVSSKAHGDVIRIM